jgi:hypothetical protein
LWEKNGFGRRIHISAGCVQASVSVDIIEFQATETFSGLGLIKLKYNSSNKLSVEKKML